MHVRTMSGVQKELVRQVVVQTKKKKKKAQAFSFITNMFTLIINNYYY